MAAVTLQSHIEGGIGVGASFVAAIEEDVVLVTEGNHLRTLSLKNAAQNFLWPGLGAITAAAVNTSAMQVAIATRSSVPGITLYSYATREPIAQLSGVLGVQATAVAISQDGSVVAAAGSAPDNLLSCWNVTNGQLLQGIKQRIEGGVTALSFCPADPLKLAASGPCGLTFLRLSRSLDTFDCAAVKAAPPHHSAPGDSGLELSELVRLGLARDSAVHGNGASSVAGRIAQQTPSSGPNSSGNGDGLIDENGQVIPPSGPNSGITPLGSIVSPGELLLTAKPHDPLAPAPGTRVPLLDAPDPEVTTPAFLAQRASGSDCWYSHCWVTEQTVAAANASGDICLFDANEGSVVARFHLPTMLPGASGSGASATAGLTCGALLATSEHIVAGCSDGVVRFFPHSLSAVVRSIVLVAPAPAFPLQGLYSPVDAELTRSAAARSLFKTAAQGSRRPPISNGASLLLEPDGHKETGHASASGDKHHHHHHSSSSSSSSSSAAADGSGGGGDANTALSTTRGRKGALSSTTAHASTGVVAGSGAAAQTSSTLAATQSAVGGFAATTPAGAAAPSSSSSTTAAAAVSGSRRSGTGAHPAAAGTSGLIDLDAAGNPSSLSRRHYGIDGEDDEEQSEAASGANGSTAMAITSISACPSYTRIVVTTVGGTVHQVSLIPGLVAARGHRVPRALVPSTYRYGAFLLHLQHLAQQAQAKAAQEAQAAAEAAEAAARAEAAAAAKQRALQLQLQQQQAQELAMQGGEGPDGLSGAIVPTLAPTISTDLPPARNPGAPSVSALASTGGARSVTVGAGRAGRKGALSSTTSAISTSGAARSHSTGPAGGAPRSSQQSHNTLLSAGGYHGGYAIHSSVHGAQAGNSGLWSSLPFATQVPGGAGISSLHPFLGSITPQQAAASAMVNSASLMSDFQTQYKNTAAGSSGTNSTALAAVPSVPVMVSGMGDAPEAMAAAAAGLCTPLAACPAWLVSTFTSSTVEVSLALCETHAHAHSQAPALIPGASGDDSSDDKAVVHPSSSSTVGASRNGGTGGADGTTGMPGSGGIIGGGALPCLAVFPAAFPVPNSAVQSVTNFHSHYHHLSQHAQAAAQAAASGVGAVAAQSPLVARTKGGAGSAKDGSAGPGPITSGVGSGGIDDSPVFYLPSNSNNNSGGSSGGASKSSAAGSAASAFGSNVSDAALSYSITVGTDGVLRVWGPPTASLSNAVASSSSSSSSSSSNAPRGSFTGGSNSNSNNNALSIHAPTAAGNSNALQPYYYGQDGSQADVDAALASAAAANSLLDPNLFGGASTNTAANAASGVDPASRQRPLLAKAILADVSGDVGALLLPSAFARAELLRRQTAVALGLPVLSPSAMQPAKETDSESGADGGGIDNKENAPPGASPVPGGGPSSPMKSVAGQGSSTSPSRRMPKAAQSALGSPDGSRSVARFGATTTGGGNNTVGPSHPATTTTSTATNANAAAQAAALQEASAQAAALVPDDTAPLKHGPKGFSLAVRPSFGLLQAHKKQSPIDRLLGAESAPSGKRSHVSGSANAAGASALAPAGSQFNTSLFNAAQVHLPPLPRAQMQRMRITCVDVHRSLPLVAVGCSDGTVIVLLIGIRRRTMTIQANKPPGWGHTDANSHFGYGHLYGHPASSSSSSSAASGSSGAGGGILTGPGGAGGPAGSRGGTAGGSAPGGDIRQSALGIQGDKSFLAVVPEPHAIISIGGLRIPAASWYGLQSVASSNAAADLLSERVPGFDGAGKSPRLFDYNHPPNAHGHSLPQSIHSDEVMIVPLHKDRLHAGPVTAIAFCPAPATPATAGGDDVEGGAAAATGDDDDAAGLGQEGANAAGGDRTTRAQQQSSSSSSSSLLASLSGPEGSLVVSDIRLMTHRDGPGGAHAGSKLFSATVVHSSKTTTAASSNPNPSPLGPVAETTEGAAEGTAEGEKKDGEESPHHQSSRSPSPSPGASSPSRPHLGSMADAGDGSGGTGAASAVATKHWMRTAMTAAIAFAFLPRREPITELLGMGPSMAGPGALKAGDAKAGKGGNNDKDGASSSTAIIPAGTAGPVAAADIATSAIKAVAPENQVISMAWATDSYGSATILLGAASGHLLSLTLPPGLASASAHVRTQQQHLLQGGSLAGWAAAHAAGAGTQAPPSAPPRKSGGAGGFPPSAPSKPGQHSGGAATSAAPVVVDMTPAIRLRARLPAGITSLALTHATPFSLLPTHEAAVAAAAETRKALAALLSAAAGIAADATPSSIGGAGTAPGTTKEVGIAAAGTGESRPSTAVGDPSSSSNKPPLSPVRGPPKPPPRAAGSTQSVEAVQALERDSSLATATPSGSTVQPSLNDNSQSKVGGAAGPSASQAASKPQHTVTISTPHALSSSSSSSHAMGPASLVRLQLPLSLSLVGPLGEGCAFVTLANEKALAVVPFDGFHLAADPVPTVKADFAIIDNKEKDKDKDKEAVLQWGTTDIETYDGIPAGTSAILSMLTAHRKAACSVALSPVARTHNHCLLASGGADGAVTVWSITVNVQQQLLSVGGGAEGKERQRSDTSEGAAGGGAGVSQQASVLAPLSSQASMVEGPPAYSVRVDSSTYLPLHGCPLEALSFTPSGRGLISFALNESAAVCVGLSGTAVTPLDSTSRGPSQPHLKPPAGIVLPSSSSSGGGGNASLALMHPRQAAIARSLLSVCSSDASWITTMLLHRYAEIEADLKLAVVVAGAGRAATTDRTLSGPLATTQRGSATGRGSGTHHTHTHNQHRGGNMHDHHHLQSTSTTRRHELQPLPSLFSPGTGRTAGSDGSSMMLAFGNISSSAAALNAAAGAASAVSEALSLLPASALPFLVPVIDPFLVKPSSHTAAVAVPTAKKAEEASSLHIHIPGGQAAGGSSAGAGTEIVLRSSRPATPLHQRPHPSTSSVPQHSGYSFSLTFRLAITPISIATVTPVGAAPAAAAPSAAASSALQLAASATSAADDAEAAAASARAALMAEAARFRQALTKLLRENEDAPETEKLDRRNDFLVDEQGYQAVLAHYDAAVARRDAAFHKKCELLDAKTKKVKEAVWEPLETPPCDVKGIGGTIASNPGAGAATNAAASAAAAAAGELSVANFPLRKRSEQEVASMNRIALTRKTEQACMLSAAAGAHQGEGGGGAVDLSKLINPDGTVAIPLPPEITMAPGSGGPAWYGLTEHFPRNADWLFHIGLLPPTLDPARQFASRQPAAADGSKPKEGEGKEGEGASPAAAAVAAPTSVHEEEDAGMSEEDMSGGEVKWEGAAIMRLLYHPGAVRTPAQKRIQAALIRELLRATRSHFNAQFEALRKEKVEVLDSVASRNARIVEILRELGELVVHVTPRGVSIAGGSLGVISSDPAAALGGGEGDAKEKDKKKTKVNEVSFVPVPKTIATVQGQNKLPGIAALPPFPQPSVPSAGSSTGAGSSGSGSSAASSGSSGGGASADISVFSVPYPRPTAGGPITGTALLINPAVAEAEANAAAGGGGPGEEAPAAASSGPTSSVAAILAASAAERTIAKTAQIVVNPCLQPSEIPGFALQISDDEIGLAPYVSEEEIRSKQEAETKKKQQDAGKQDDAPMRALQDMMGGTLAKKDELQLLEEAVASLYEPWMEQADPTLSSTGGGGGGSNPPGAPPAAGAPGAAPGGGAGPAQGQGGASGGSSGQVMTEEKHARLALYKMKLAQLEEERVKRRNALAAELTRLVTEVKDSSAAFDEKLQQLAKQRQAVATALAAQELYAGVLTLSVQEREKINAEDRALEAAWLRLVADEEEAADAHEAFAQEVEQAMRALEEARAHDRALEKGFRESLKEAIHGGHLDSDIWRVVTGLFKKRAPIPMPAPAVSSSAMMGSVEDHHNNNNHAVVARANRLSGVGHGLAAAAAAGAAAAAAEANNSRARSATTREGSSSNVASARPASAGRSGSSSSKIIGGKLPASKKPVPGGAGVSLAAVAAAAAGHHGPAVPPPAVPPVGGGGSGGGGGNGQLGASGLFNLTAQPSSARGAAGSSSSNNNNGGSLNPFAYVAPPPGGLLPGSTGPAFGSIESLGGGVAASSSVSSGGSSPLPGNVGGDADGENGGAEPSMLSAGGSMIPPPAAPLSPSGPSSPALNYGPSLAIQAASAASNIAAGLNPATVLAEAAKERALSAARFAAIEPLTKTDIPEGYGASVMDNAPLWRKLNQLRQQKILSEWTVAQSAVRLEDMRAHLAHLAHRYESLRDRIDAIGAERDALASQREVSLNDIFLLLRLRMGQDEVAGTPVPIPFTTTGAGSQRNAGGAPNATAIVAGLDPLTDYSDAMFLPAGVIESVNADIVARGKVKVDVLTEVKEFRRNLLYMDWERRYLSATAKDEAEFFRDVQLMRAMGVVGEFIKGVNVASKARKDLDKANERLEFMRVNHQRTMDKLGKSAGKLDSHIQDKQAEINRLEARKKELEEAVSLREAIFRSRSTLKESGGFSGLGGTAKMDRMKVVAAKSRLHVFAKQQEEELAILRKEAERLRKKSYPSFN